MEQIIKYGLLEWKSILMLMICGKLLNKSMKFHLYQTIKHLHR
jgi:hypothetical protein